MFPINIHTLHQRSHSSVQKLLFSATLTQNPEKLAPLSLYNPILFATASEKLENKSDKETGDLEKDSKDGEYIKLRNNVWTSPVKECTFCIVSSFKLETIQKVHSFTGDVRPLFRRLSI